MKKKILAVLLASAMVVSLAACGGSGSSDSSDGSTAAPVTSDDENTLTVYAWDKNFNIPALEAAAADYKENVNKDFNLEVIEQSQSTDVENAITLAGSAGDYSTLPDIVLFQDHWAHKYITDYPDAFQSMDDVDVNWDDFSQEKLSYSMIDGEHFGLPVDNGTVIFAYRTDLLQEAGYSIDDVTGCTWDKFIEVGEAVYAKTGKYLLSMDGDGNDLPYMMLQAEGESQFTDGKPTFAENEKFVQIIDKIEEMISKNVLYLANDWSAYTDQTITNDMVAGVMNGNWIIPTIEQVSENSGKWEITSIPTLEGGEGYASNGGSSLYITANCEKTDLAKDFLTYTFGGSSATYDKALTDGGVITTCISAGQSEVYNEGVEYFGGQPIYAKIVEMGANVPVIEQSDSHYGCRKQVAAAIINIKDGAKTADALKEAQEQVNFEMGN
ncbi:MAG: ABC transporter substrate-binding protein [Hespellia sp.]|nr:ABC transporter substrate-binding protein [Hespellia sp.]